MSGWPPARQRNLLIVHPHRVVELAIPVERQGLAHVVLVARRQALLGAKPTVGRASGLARAGRVGRRSHHGRLGPLPAIGIVALAH
uniref:Transposase n=1 Tax=Heterorhabditis bacteriophora TaxID=37862 RepID=A0A1I7WCH8_HETBA